MRPVGIVGASGFTGAELLRLCAQHPDLEVAFATGDTQAGTPIAALYPHLAATYGERRFDEYRPGMADDVAVVFLGLPHGASQTLVPELLSGDAPVIDLAADFRLRDPDLYPRWYDEEHRCPELLATAAYGLPELFRDELDGAALVAAPGCYPTAAALALAPLVRGGFADPRGIVVDAASGLSGAGRAPKAHTTFCAADENVAGYGLLSHRHTPEIEQTLGRLAAAAADDAGAAPPRGAVATDDGVAGAASVLFTPHLVPMTRGILATCYARPAPGVAAPDTAGLLAHYRAAYADEAFVHVTDEPPGTKATLGSNAAHVTVRHDERTGWLLAMCALDNLVKGASGQAVQCANRALGLDEARGLPREGVAP